MVITSLTVAVAVRLIGMDGWSGREIQGRECLFAWSETYYRNYMQHNHQCLTINDNSELGKDCVKAAEQCEVVQVWCKT